MFGSIRCHQAFIGQRLNQTLGECQIVPSYVFHSDVENGVDAVGRDYEWLNGGCAAPETIRFFGVTKIVAVEFKRVLVREPADIKRLAGLLYLRAHPEKAGTGPAAQPFDARPDDEVRRPGRQIDGHTARGLRDVDDRHDTFSPGRPRDTAHGHLPAGIRLDMCDQYYRRAFIQGCAPMAGIGTFRTPGNRPQLVADALCLLQDEGNGRKVFFGVDDGVPAFISRQALQDFGQGTGQVDLWTEIFRRAVEQP